MSSISSAKSLPAKPTQQASVTADKENSSLINSDQLSAIVQKQEDKRFQPALPRPKLLYKLNSLPDRRVYSEKNSELVDDKTLSEDESNGPDSDDSKESSHENPVNPATTANPEKSPVPWQKDVAARRKDLLAKRERSSNNAIRRPKLEKQKALQQLTTSQDIEERTAGPFSTFKV